MTKIAAEVEIEASIEHVFSVVTDAARLGDWIEVHEDVDEAPELPLEEGDAFEQQVEVKGARVPITWTATTVEEPRLVEWIGEGPAGSTARARVELEPRGDARTCLRYACEYDPPGGVVGAVANKVAGERAATAQAEASFERLRALLAPQ
jgi:uncharacterized membrane protein